MLHWLLWLVARVIYRLRVVGREHIPAHGPALLISNHVSYIDWLFLMAASRRKVRFVIAGHFLDLPVIGWILRRCRVIPLARAAGPKAMMQTFSNVSAALTQGDVVCVFPEGYPTRTGVMLRFRRGFEQVARVESLPIVPIYLDQVWGSRFSYKGGGMFWKRSKRGPYPVSVVIGAPLSNLTSATEVRQVIQVLAAEHAKERTQECLPMHRQFVRTAASHPFRPCLIDPASKIGSLTYGKALAGSMILSNWLRPRIGREPMVGIWLPSSIPGLLANVALALLGKPSVNLNYTAGIESIRSAVRQCNLRKVITAQKFLDRMPLDLGPDVELIKLEEARAETSNASRIITFLKVVLLPGVVLDWLLDLPKHRPSHLATVIFSSGSTGEPKGILLTNQNITSNVEAFKEYVDFNRHDRVLGMLPFFHSFGYTVTLWGTLMAGAAAVFHADPRAAKEVGELCRNYRCTLMAATATFLRMYLRRCDPDDFKSMRLLACGAEKLPPSVIEEFKAKFGVEPVEGYGCTETSPVISVNIADRTINQVKQIGTKIGSVGHPLPGIAARVVDPDTQQPRSIDEDGLLLVTGPNVMKGYLGREDLNRAKLLAGWYVTGDIARIDADGFITLTGRIERFAKIAGEMVPLELLEEEMHKILGSVERVLVVAAVPDKKRGERLVVLYLPLPGMSMRELLKKLGERGIPNLWIPDERDSFPVAEFPILGSGKLDLAAIKKVALERYPDA